MVDDEGVELLRKLKLPIYAASTREIVDRSAPR
jgi:hypothetical protein